MRSFLKLIGYIVGAFIFYVLLCMLWGALYRFYQATVNKRQSTHDEEMEFGMTCFNILLVIIFINLGIGYFADQLNQDVVLAPGVGWYQRLLEITIVYPFASLTIGSILVGGILNYE
jgi:uncharacterized membrane protein YcgQ (UPF0703/DUF1980 family)